MEFSYKCEILQVDEKQCIHLVVTQNRVLVILGFIYSLIVFLSSSKVVHFFG